MVQSELLAIINIETKVMIIKKLVIRLQHGEFGSVHRVALEMKKL